MNSVDPTQPVPVAIIGMGCMFPKAEDLATYWANIRSKVDAIGEVPPSHWRPDDYYDADPKAPDRTYARRGGFLDPVDFPALDFGIAPNNLDATDTTQLLGLMVARAALVDAGYGPGGRDFDRKRVNVILGVTGALEQVIPLGARLGHPIWRRALQEAGVQEPLAEDVVRRISESYVGWQENSFPGLLGNVAAGRIANRLDLGGTNCVVDAACASSIAAVHLAMLELAAGRCDLALSGGLDTFNDIFMYMCFSKTPALSPSGDARPFDASCDGTTLGEGLGILALKRLDDARRDGDRIYAVIRSVGSSSDGKGNAVYAPSSSGQAEALRRAYELAGVGPETVGLVEAHGTGTKVGDATELAGLVEVYREAQADGTWCALGSVKSQIGHTKAAAGAAGLIKAALALHRKVLPPTAKVTKPMAGAESGRSPFYLNTEARPWLPPRAGHPRRSAVSAFGFGGSNFHCVLEEADPAAVGFDWDGDVQILAASAATPAALGAALDGVRRDATWADFRLEASRSRASFDPTHPHRVVVVAEQKSSDLPALLDRARAHLLDATPGTPAPDGVFVGEGPAAGTLAMLFPGQGSQYVGMLRELSCVAPPMLDALALADAAGCPVAAIDPHPAFSDEARLEQERALRATEVAQPAIGATSLGLLGVLEHFGVRPDAVAGHSFGELTALHAAGRLNAADFLALARRRGELMAEAGRASGERGGMLAVLAPIGRVEAAIREAKLDLVVANRNAPSQAVISGPSAEIARGSEVFEKLGLTTRPLEVSAAFHSRLVAGAEAPFLAAARESAFGPGSIPVYANATASPYPDDPDAARELLAGQLARPVDFVGMIRAMAESGVGTFLEVGPGAVLTGLVGSTLADLPHVALAVDASRGRRGNVADLARSLARLAAAGHPVRLDRWDEAAAARAFDPPAKAALTVKVSGANFAPKPAAAPRPPLTPPAKPPEQLRPAAAKPNGRHVPPPAPDAATAPSALAGRNGTHRIGPMSQSPADPPAALPRPETLPAMPIPAGAGDRAMFDRAIREAQENLVALQKLGEQTAQLHRQFLDGQDRTQGHFAALLDQQQRLTFASMGAAPAPALAPIARPEPPQTVARLATPPPAARIPVTPPPKPAPRPATRPAATAAPAPAPTPRPIPAPVVAPSIEAASVLLEVVAAKTGYPAEVLDPAMQLDADLGIDSIKRVEILAAVQERLPDAPAVGPEHLGTLRTLQQIIDFLGRGATAAPAPVASAKPSAEVASVLLEVVAAKTGYPAEVLDPAMQLDADLGIDSIKRVEILAAVQERLPDAPAVGPEHLGTLRTLQQIIDFLGQDATAATAVPSAKPSSTVADILLEVVAAKTGYPAEVLDPAMQLDADLGIDSIKRVEILAAVQERLPDAPAVGPEHLGTLRTLQQIIDFLGQVGPAPEVSIPVGPTAVARPSVRPGGVDRRVLTRVALGDRGANGSPRIMGDIWIGDDGQGVARAMAARLEASGCRCRVIASGEIADLATPDRLGGLIVLAPIGGAGDSAIMDAFRLLRAAGPALKRAGGGAIFATVARLDGGFGMTGPDASGGDATAGALAGLAKTAGREWPDVRCRAIDLDPAVIDPDEAAALVVDEISRGGPEEVGLGRGVRSGLELVPTPVPTGGAFVPVAAGELVVVTGGARGVTAEVAEALATAFRPALLVLGRSPQPEAEPDWLAPVADEAAIKRALLARANGRATPKALGEEFARVAANREVVANLRRIEANGSSVLYRAVDVRDPDAVRSAIDEARARFGPLRGLVHGAGVLADRHIVDQTDEQFGRVYATKVHGLRNLLAAAGGDDLRMLVLFSSSTARYGRAGQVAYAAANEVLNKTAWRESRARPGCRVVAANWGPWDGGMVTPSLRPLFEAEGVPLIDPAAGASYLVEELRTPPGPGVPIEVVILGASARPEPAAPDPTPPPSGLALAFERRVDATSVPVLASHVIDGRPVLPMALILEWLAEGALQRNPGLSFVGLDNLQILKGVVLRDDRGETLRVLAGKASRSGSAFRVEVELRSIAGDGRDVPHAKATVILADRLPAIGSAGEPLDLPPSDLDPDAIYREILFHGPALQGIELVEGCGPEGIVARVATSPSPSDWIDRPARKAWAADPLALDCAFQMMILWSVERTGAGSLPTGIGRYRQARRAFPEGPIRVVARVTRAEPHKAIADVEFLDEDGSVVARIDDYECVIDASLNTAFRRNQPARAERS